VGKQSKSAPERAKGGERREKYSIRESEGDKIVQKDEETDKDGKTAEREENTKSCMANWQKPASEAVANQKKPRKKRLHSNIVLPGWQKKLIKPRCRLAPSLNSRVTGDCFNHGFAAINICA